jgi:5-methylcytosine-specific restriction protein A
MPDMPPTFRPSGFKGRKLIDRDYKARRKDHPDQRFLATAAWRSVLRPQQLAKEPFCEQCEREGRRYVPATEVDHIRVPHGDPALQRDPANLQSMCASCHGQKTRADQGGRVESPQSNGL